MLSHSVAWANVLMIRVETRLRECIRALFGDNISLYVRAVAGS